MNGEPEKTAPPEFVDNTEVLTVGEADTEVEDGGEETLSFKHVEGTEALDMTEVEVTNAETESVLLGAFSSLQITS